MGKGCKVVVCGLLSVGKTAILEQLLYGNHTIAFDPSQGCSNKAPSCSGDWAVTRHQTYRYLDLGLLASRTVREKFSVYKLPNLWYFVIVAIVVLGNKIDLSEQRQVDAEVAQQWAKSEKVRLWEVTVTDRKTLIEPFTLLASKLSQPQSKSSFPLPGRKNKGNSSSEN
ncbi:NF-kappa-B inhibitor-interacting Ras-like protein 1 [Cebus imitator]|uniref:NF-kappa-B inhibitor-interacting Ras-like protein 1 n=1 Tax=Cebus imitator TaxID=2715852 RepID=UPI00189BEA96|nr:NF-kappa-B inhibitor-interacting Ras-like protein 1 [Cebus imitator]